MNTVVVIDPCDMSAIEALPNGGADLMIVTVPRWSVRLVKAVADVAWRKVTEEGGQLIIATSLPAAFETL
jgi:hypothetical protein